MKNDYRLKTLKILFIDDDWLLRSSMEYYFKKKVFSFVVIESAEQAIERLKDERFDVVICDYKLPGMDGLTFFENLYNKHPGMKKILITAYGDKDLEESAHMVGINHFILKPFDSEKIKRAIME
ncbi:MAG: response regulator [Deltaproteobacteria bacterium]|nr:response regulator [Deltaproteobacteria bacterium]